jgi:hypothetical protein
LAGGDLDNYLGNVAFGIPFGAMLLDEAGGALLDESGDVMEAG